MSDDTDTELGSNIEPAPAAKPRAKKAKDTEARTWIQLEENEDIPPTGLYLGHNGDGYMIVAGEPVHVPNKVIEILDHAIITMPVIDPSTRRVSGYRERMRFPYRLVAAPADTE